MRGGGKDELLKGLLASSCLFEIYGKRIYLCDFSIYFIFIDVQKIGPLRFSNREPCARDFL